MNWKTEKRKLKDLLPYDKNPRNLTSKQKEEIEKSLQKFNLVEIPAINTDNKIIAGHQRIKILMELKGGEYEIDVRVPDKKLNEKEYEEYLLRSNRNTADWDWNILETFDKDMLLGSGFESFEIDVDELNLKKAFADMESTKKKVKAGKCSVCGGPLNLEVRYILRDKSFDNFNFAPLNDEAKLIYEKVKEFMGDRKINIIIEQK